MPRRSRTQCAPQRYILINVFYSCPEPELVRQSNTIARRKYFLVAGLERDGKVFDGILIVAGLRLHEKIQDCLSRTKGSEKAAAGLEAARDVGEVIVDGLDGRKIVMQRKHAAYAVEQPAGLRSTLANALAQVLAAVPTKRLESIFELARRLARFIAPLHLYQRLVRNIHPAHVPQAGSRGAPLVYIASCSAAEVEQ